MRINDLANNNNSISNGTAAGVSLDLSLVQGAVSPEKNRSAALLNQNMGAVGFFYTSEKKPVMDTGKATYTLNDAKGVEKDKGMGEKLLDSIGDASRRDRELVKNLTKDDYDSLNEEGMSLEKFGKERLERAIERIKEDRRIKEERLSEGAEKLKVYNETIDRMAETAHAETGEEKRIAMLLAKADIPVTKDNIEEVEQALDKAEKSVPFTDSSKNYLIKNELVPSIGNVYKASHSGEMHLKKMDEAAWENLKEDAVSIVRLAGLSTEKGLSDARWLIERNLPVTEENLLYKSELDTLDDKDKFDGYELAEAVVSAMEKGLSADDGLILDRDLRKDNELKAEINAITDKLTLINDGDIREAFIKGVHEDEISLEKIDKAREERMTVTSFDLELSDEELRTKARLEEIRISLNIEAGRRLMSKGIDIMSEPLIRVCEGIREMEKEYFTDLYREIDADFKKNGIAGEFSEIDDDAERLAELAIKTKYSLKSVANAPLEVYKETFHVRHTVTLTALASYESSATGVRKDLGDSLSKAFSGSVDSLLKENGLELSEANRRAVRILGYNRMEINKSSIEEMKYYDAKITGLIKRMTPPVVMALIRDGINPLEKTIDELDIIVNERLMEQGESPEQKYSEFLVNMESAHSITENERNAYIGIYRLIYNVEKNEGSAIGRLLNSGKELTFRNLMTEVRTKDLSISLTADDSSDISSSYYTNSVTGQIDEAFMYQRRIMQDILGNTDADAWDRALSGKEYLSVTPEILDEGLNAAKVVKTGFNNPAWGNDAGKVQDIVNTMTANTPTAVFLNSFGITDSYRNRKALEDVFMNPEEEGSAFSMSTEEMDDALDSRSRFDELLGIKTRMANTLAGQAFSTAINAQAAAELNKRVERIEMVRKLAGKEHFRLKIEDGDETKNVNLTIIRNTGNAGTVSVSISKEAYEMQADIGMVLMDSKYNGPSVGKANLRFEGGLPEDKETIMSRIKGALKDNGIMTDNINIASGIRPEASYRSYLAQQKQQESGAEDDEGLGNADALYRAAKSLLSVL